MEKQSSREVIITSYTLYGIDLKARARIKPRMISGCHQIVATRYRIPSAAFSSPLGSGTTFLIFMLTSSVTAWHRFCILPNLTRSAPFRISIPNCLSRTDRGGGFSAKPEPSMTQKRKIIPKSQPIQFQNCPKSTKKPRILRFWAFSVVRRKGLEPPTY